MHSFILYPGLLLGMPRHPLCAAHCPTTCNMHPFLEFFMHLVLQFPPRKTHIEDLYFLQYIPIFTCPFGPLKSRVILLVRHIVLQPAICTPSFEYFMHLVLQIPPHKTHTLGSVFPSEHPYLLAHPVLCRQPTCCAPRLKPPFGILSAILPFI